jgi:hypothetical protein
MIEVWHRKKPTFMLFNSEDFAEHQAAWKSGEYELVATIEKTPPTDTEEDYAFFITNSIEDSWTENAGVKPVKKNLRSTSMGDVVKRSDGTLLLCSAMGWQKILGDPINLARRLV